MLKRILISIIVNFSWCYLLFSQTNLDRIAVLNLDAVSIGERESITFTDRLRSELVKSGAFIVIERSEMDEILNEQGFQQSGCTTDECAVEIGKLLNINRICAGSVGKIGSLYTVTLRMIDVETGQILVTVTEDCQCPIEEVLTKSMKNITEKLVTASKEYIKPIIGGKGDIYIKSNPTAALVFINGKPTGKTTPTTIRDLDTGEQLIKVVKGELVGSKLLRVNANDIEEVNINLGKAKGGLKIYSTPVEADIYIGENFFGRTPKVINDLALGDHIVTLKKSEYLDIVKSITITAGDYKSIEGNLVKPAELIISSIPNNADIKISGKLIGTAPVSLDSLYPEKIYVEVSHPGYFTERRYIELREAFVNNEVFNLKKSPSITINANIPGSSVFINDKFQGYVPLNLESFSESRIKIVLKKENYDDWHKIISLQEGKNENILASLKPTIGKLSIKTYPDTAVIEIDGKNYGSTPLYLNINYGEHSVLVSSPKFKTISEKIVIDKPKINKEFKLEYKTGKLILDDLSEGSFVFINGKKAEQDISEFNIPIGIHKIEIEKSGYERKIYNYVSQENQSSSFEGNLKHKTNLNALWRSAILPGWGQYYQEKPTQTWIYPTVFAGCVLGSYLTIENYNQAVDDYNIARDEYLKAFSAEDINRTRAAMDKTYDDVDSKESTRNIMFIATGAIWVWNVLDTMILPPGYKSNVKLSTKSDNNKVMAGVSLSF